MPAVAVAAQAGPAFAVDDGTLGIRPELESDFFHINLAPGAAIDANARRAGLSRTEYIRRALSRERADSGPEVSVEDLATFAATFVDLGDSEVMRRAWS